MTEQRPVERLAVANVAVLDVARVEEGTDVLGRVMRNGAGESVRQDSDPGFQIVGFV